VLKHGSTIKTQRDAKLTMVCKEGRPISLTREGSFPVELWKDSCNTSHASVSTKYFQYIWDQLYGRSDDYKRDHPEGYSTISEAPVRGNDEKEILITGSLDTVNYASDHFRVSWSASFDHSGPYIFVVKNTKTKKQVYLDSNKMNTRSLYLLKKYMKPGNSYSWTVSCRETGPVEGGVINYVPVKTVSQHILRLRKATTVPEEMAAQYFRIGYMLQQDHYLADAYTYFRKAALTDPSTPFYSEMLSEFVAKFKLAD
jgi:hypothetical protein